MESLLYFINNNEKIESIIGNLFYLLDGNSLYDDEDYLNYIYYYINLILELILEFVKENKYNSLEEILNDFNKISYSVIGHYFFENISYEIKNDDIIKEMIDKMNKIDIENKKKLYYKVINLKRCSLPLAGKQKIMNEKVENKFKLDTFYKLLCIFVVSSDNINIDFNKLKIFMKTIFPDFEDN